MARALKHPGRMRIGGGAAFFNDRPGALAQAAPPRDLRLRLAARVPDRQAAELVITEVEALYDNGPAGGGGVRSAQRPTIRTYTAFIDRAQVTPRCTFVEG